jgi:hypothetical protein
MNKSKTLLHSIEILALKELKEMVGITDIDEKRDEMLKIAMTNSVSDDISSHYYMYLFSAVTNNNINLVQKHIDNKVNIHAENDIALWSACENGYQDIVKLLFEHSTNKNIDYDRMINACKTGYQECIKLLLEEHSTNKNIYYDEMMDQLKNNYFLTERLINEHKLKNS